MFEITISILFLILIIIVFLRMIFLTVDTQKNGILAKLIKLYISLSDSVFNSLDNKINFAIGKLKLSYIIIILLLMLLQKLILLLLKKD